MVDRESVQRPVCLVGERGREEGVREVLKLG